LNEAGEVVKTVPNAELLESEDFESEFSISYLSKLPMDEVQKIVTAISEVEKVEISEVSAFEEAAPAEKQEAQPEQKKEEVSVPAAKAPANDAPKANGNNGAAAGGTKTIRVNIDRLDSLMNLFEELVIDRGRLEQIAKELENNELTDTVER
ncbi:chemotaxis protein CheA, partial [Escherichia coli]|nr:chemotaxis protein CheA [Escherichia coli]